MKLPLLCKDFIIDARQILEAVDAGADAILLIARILTAAELGQLHALACAAGLAALVEVHDGAEMDRALSLGAKLIGVNNRNLDTFTVDLGLTGRLAARIPAGEREGRVLVAESGIHHRADVELLRRAGAGAILVGESLMKQPRRHPRQNLRTAYSLMSCKVARPDSTAFLIWVARATAVSVVSPLKVVMVVLRAAMTSPLRSRNGWVTSTEFVCLR